jgi:hypothetical protein
LFQEGVCTMFNWFSRSPRSRSSALAHRARPWLEALEDRACPTASPPAMLNLYAVQTAPHVVHVAGAVHDNNLSSGDTVTLSGGLNTAVQVSPDGTFDIQLSSPPTATIVATAVNDATLMASSQTTYTFSADAPVVTSFGADHNYGNNWTFSGRVQAGSATGPITIQLGGLQSLQNVTATCNSDGTFFVTLNLTNAGNDTGLASVTATDANGLTSQEAKFWVIGAQDPN